MARRRSQEFGRRLGGVLAHCGLGALLAAGCASTSADDYPVEGSDSSRVAPALEPPPSRGPALGREEVARIARDQSPDDANRTLDRSPFAFELTPETLDWFSVQGIDPQTLHYLELRSKIDWEATRGTIDPDAPP
jgi:hypothetical protein